MRLLFKILLCSLVALASIIGIIYNVYDPLPSEIQGYKVLARLGKGNFGKVFKVNKDGEEFALKVVQNDLVSETAFINGVEIMKSLDHPNILRYHAHFRDEKESVIVTELADKTLTIEHKNKKLSEKEIRQVLKTLFEATEYMHEQEIIHRDLKPDNIMFKYVNGSRLGGTIKIIDLDSATKAPFSRYEVLGTPDYFPPESLLKYRQEYPGDIWSLGCIMMELYEGYTINRRKNYKNPYSPYGDFYYMRWHYLYNIFEITGSPNNAIWPGIEAKLNDYPRIKNIAKIPIEKILPKLSKNADALDLIKNIFTLDLEKRINRKNALKHDYFKI